MQDLSNRARALPAPGIVLAGRVWIIVLAALAGARRGAARRGRSPPSDPPGRAARLSEVERPGLAVQPATPDEWIAVERNRPLTTGDRIATDNGARAEITLGSTTLRLDAATELEIARLDDNVLQRAPARRQRRRPAAQPAVAGRVRADHRRRALSRSQAVGRYRFDRFDQTSDVTVFSGQAIYEARNTRAAGDRRPACAVLARRAPACRSTRCCEPARDAFAGWNDERDRAEDRAGRRRARYVSPEMTGAEDLDRYGAVGADARVRRDLDAALGRRRLGAVHAPATGPGCGPGAGPGSTTRRGASRRSTTAAGSTIAILVLGAGHLRRPAGLRAGAGGLDRRRRASTSRSRSAAAPAGRLVPARAARGLRAGLPRQPALRAQRQRHPRHQRHQDHDDRQQPQRRGRPARLRQPQVPACGDRGAGERDDRPRAGRPPTAARVRNDPQVRALVADTPAGAGD